VCKLAAFLPNSKPETFDDNRRRLIDVVTRSALIAMSRSLVVRISFSDGCYFMYVKRGSAPNGSSAAKVSLFPP
jgi:hypothetical protein